MNAIDNRFYREPPAGLTESSPMVDARTKKPPVVDVPPSQFPLIVELTERMAFFMDQGLPLRTSISLALRDTDVMLCRPSTRRDR